MEKEESSLEFAGLHQVLSVLTPLRSYKLEMVTAGEQKYLQQSDRAQRDQCTGYKSGSERTLNAEGVGGKTAGDKGVSFVHSLTYKELNKRSERSGTQCKPHRKPWKAGFLTVIQKEQCAEARGGKNGATFKCNAYSAVVRRMEIKLLLTKALA